jgi:hypothetical protein
VIRNLGRAELLALLERVFGSASGKVLVLVDLPDARRPDHPRWEDRRRIAIEWFEALRPAGADSPFSGCELATYPNVGSNNRDLPAEVRISEPVAGDVVAADGRAVPLRELLRGVAVVLAPTELSATAPLKLLASELGFRGATLGDFRREMIPALALDWYGVDARVRQFADRLDRADGADLQFSTTGAIHRLHLDLRGQRAHVSGGLIRGPGTVSNLPTGEAFIVPYEGERPGDPSRTHGVLPVQLDGEIVLYRIAANRAVEVLSEGPRARAEAAALEQEPAYGNLAELGLGVLRDWGIQAIGAVLLDEKLGPHIAFGRSDHFGGAVGPPHFRDPERVVHIDRVYVPECQPGVQLARLALVDEQGNSETLVSDGAYVL